MPLVTSQALPGDDPSVDPKINALARELALALGPAYQPADNTLIAEDLRALAYLLVTLYDEQTHLMKEVHPQSAVDLLTEWETRLGVATNTSLSNSDRQALIVAARRATGAADRKTVMDAIHAIDPSASLYTNTATAMAALGLPRGVFCYAVILDGAVWNDPIKREAIRIILNRSKPSHTSANLAIGRGFRCNASPLGQVVLSSS